MRAPVCLSWPAGAVMAHGREAMYHVSYNRVRAPRSEAPFLPTICVSVF
jgi:hypothetical protein